MSAYSEALALQDALPRTGSIPWEIGKVYNALLDAAKQERPDSVSLRALDPLQRNAVGFAGNVTAESLRTMVAVVAAASNRSSARRSVRGVEQRLARHLRRLREPEQRQHGRRDVREDALALAA